MKLMAELQQVKMEMETMQGVNTNLTIENIALKHKAVDYLQQIKDMKIAIKNLTAGNKDEIEDIKYMFLTKKGQLVEIINGLKTKVNSLQADIARENEIKDNLLTQERDLVRRLKAEIVRAKNVLMSSELTIKAH